jgi:serpin B
LDAIQNNFNAPVEKVDFKDPVNREKARIKINDWTADKTNQKIKDLLEKTILEDSTKLVVVNAVYFLAGWQLEFKKELTKPATFYGLTKSSEKAFMQMGSLMKYAEENGVSLLEIPYIQNKASMIILLPDDSDKFLDLQYNIDNDYLNALYNKSTPIMVNLLLPKFKIEYKTDLKEAFFNAGMMLPFIEAANFSAIVAQNNIMISHIIHQTFITVDEEGTEAAAATAILWTTKSIQKIINFNANRPFIFLIRDNATGSILFMGQLVN